MIGSYDSLLLGHHEVQYVAIFRQLSRFVSFFVIFRHSNFGPSVGDILVYW